MRHLTALAFAAALSCGLFLALPSFGGEPPSILSLDHFVEVKSTAPAIAGQTAVLYVRERRQSGPIPKPAALADRVVLFVHGAGTPAEVSFDVPYRDFSWMAFLAKAGFDVFAVDMTGYGRSTRPAPMNDPCNAPAASQTQFVGNVLAAPCPPSSSLAVSTLASDWTDVGAAVDYVRKLRQVDKISLIGWSMGGPRSGGYAAQNQDKISKMVLLAPAYGGGGAGRGATPAADGQPAAAAPARGRGAAQGGGAGRGDGAAARGGAAPAGGRGAGSLFSTQSHQELVDLWNRQAPCPGQYEQATLESVFSEMMASDPVGARWGTGVRRAPAGGGGGGATWTQEMVAKTMIPTLAVSGVHDGQVNPASVKAFYEALGAKQKVFIDLACSSHNAMWEKNHLLLFQASLDWLTQTSVQGTSNGVLKLGY
jgi:pimeloyl-ACP methyl ester carboxylesterase